MRPIFFGVTRSFWLGIVPALLTAIDILFGLFADPALGVPVAQGIAWVIGMVAPVTASDVQRVMAALAPVYAFIVAQQRSGAARPYTLDWRARE